MSENRIPDMSFTRTIAREQGKIKSVFESARFEVYNAGQFSTRLDGKNFSRKIPLRKSERKEFYLTAFRLRINYRWYNPSGGRYEFFSMDQVSKIITTWSKESAN